MVRWKSPSGTHILFDDDAQEALEDLIEKLKTGLSSASAKKDVEKLLDYIDALDRGDSVDCQEVELGLSTRIKITSGKYYAILEYPGGSNEGRVLAFGTKS